MRLYDAFSTPTSLILVRPASPSIKAPPTHPARRSRPLRARQVCQLASGGELLQFADLERQQPLVHTEAQAKRYTLQLLHGLTHLHERGVVHRDLKPSNILLSDQSPAARVLIADFDLARTVDGPVASARMETVCGSVQYMAPEMVHCLNGIHKDYDAKIDTWGVALISYTIIFGANPFRRPVPTATADAIVSGSLDFLSGADASADFIAFIRLLLSVDPAERPTAEAAAAHAWLTDAEASVRISRSSSTTGAMHCATPPAVRVTRETAQASEMEARGGTPPPLQEEAPVSIRRSQSAKKYTRKKRTSETANDPNSNIAIALQQLRTVRFDPPPAPLDLHVSRRQ